MDENNAELQVLRANSRFTLNLYEILAKKEGNVIFSPISAHAVLSMTYQGAQGSTAEKFASALQVQDARSTAEGYRAIMGRLNSVEKVTLLMANKIFLKESLTLLNDFSTAVTENFSSEVQLVDFGQSEEAAATINNWVEEKTNNKITNVMQRSDLDDTTALVLVNAIYFKGTWKTQFEKKETKMEQFYLNDVDKISVQMMHMHMETHLRYDDNEELDAQLLELPYTNEDLSMLLILPNKKNGIGDLEEKLATTNLSEIIDNMWEEEVDVALPRFKIQQTIHLEDALVKLGLGDIFDPCKANFKGLVSMESLHVSKAIQKAFIEVNEEGAEAAAASVVTEAFMTCSTPREFYADHPFVYILAEKRTNPIFMGRITQPESSSQPGFLSKFGFFEKFDIFKKFTFQH